MATTEKRSLLNPILASALSDTKDSRDKELLTAIEDAKKVRSKTMGEIRIALDEEFERNLQQQKPRQIITEVPNIGVYPDQETFNKLEPARQKRDKELLTDAVLNTKDSRAKALNNAHNALVDAFGPKLNSMIVGKVSISEGGLTEMDLDELIRELEGAPEDDDMIKECKKRLNEAKDPSVSTTEKEKMYRDIHRKFWAYVQSLPERSVSISRPPTDTDVAVKKFMTGKWQGGIQYISYEGSAIASALIAVSDSADTSLNMSQLPESDRIVLKEEVRNHFGNINVSPWISVRFDNYKNFEFSFQTNTVKERVQVTIGNRVVSIPPSEAAIGGSDVKVESKGKDILIGDRIKIEKSRIQNLVSPTDSTNNGANRGLSSPARQKVSGRNAYEIRADILEMALDFAKNSNDKRIHTDDVLDIAEAFYSFVEHK